jgi:uncharacterized membrane protein
MKLQTKKIFNLYIFCAIIAFFSLVIIASIKHSFEGFSFLFNAFWLLLLTPLIGLIIQIIFVCIYELVKLFLDING